MPAALEPVGAPDDDAKAEAAFQDLEWEAGEEAVKAEAVTTFKAFQAEADALIARIASTLGNRARARTIFERAIASLNRPARGPRDPEKDRALMAHVRQLEASTPASKRSAIPRRVATMVAGVPGKHRSRYGNSPTAIEKHIRRALAKERRQQPLTLEPEPPEPDK